MSSLKKTLMTRGMKLMSDPRVLKLMQDERVMKAIMQMMAVPGRVQSFTHEQVERLAKSMALATEDEMKDLKRTVRRLEEEIARMKQADRRERERASSSDRGGLDARADSARLVDERPSTRSVAGSAAGGAAKKKATSAE